MSVVLPPNFLHKCTTVLNYNATFLNSDSAGFERLKSSLGTLHTSMD